MRKDLILILQMIILLSACNQRNQGKNDFSQLLKKENENLYIRYPNPERLDSICKERAMRFSRLHNIRISNFYEMYNGLGYDYDLDGDIDSIYLFKPINQIGVDARCFETLDEDSSILLTFRNYGGKQILNGTFRNLFCPMDALILYEDLSHRGSSLILEKDFGSSNNRKIKNKFYFSWKKNNFYVDSILTWKDQERNKFQFKDKKIGSITNELVVL